MSEEKLKPCPFCEPEKSDPELIDHRTDWFVRCNGCNVVVYGETVNHLDHINDEDEAQAAFDAVDWDTLRKTAIDKWNARALLLPTQEFLRLKELECEQLKSTIDKMQSNYGDNWFDGFLAALDMYNGEYDELDSIKTSTILEMSERAEEEYLDKAK